MAGLPPVGACIAVPTPQAGCGSVRSWIVSFTSTGWARTPTGLESGEKAETPISAQDPRIGMMQMCLTRKMSQKSPRELGFLSRSGVLRTGPAESRLR